MDLVRTLLLKVEDMHIPAGSVFCFDWNDDFFHVPGYDRDTAVQHFDLLVTAGFIAAPQNQGATAFLFTGLTWEGHEFIDSIRSPEVWSKTTAALKGVGGVGLELMLQVAKAEGKRLLSEKLGLPL
jgi:hypothetical protein